MGHRVVDYRRLLFDRLKFEHLNSGHCSALVALLMRDEDMFVGSCEGIDDAGGQLTCAATATLRALEFAAHSRVRFDLDIIEPVTPFACVIAKIAVWKLVGGSTLLCGSSRTNGSQPEAGVKAVLNATDRLFQTEFMYLG